jgi:hypothetical protein
MAGWIIGYRASMIGSLSLFIWRSLSAVLAVSAEALPSDPRPVLGVDNFVAARAPNFSKFQ